MSSIFFAYSIGPFKKQVFFELFRVCWESVRWPRKKGKNIHNSEGRKRASRKDHCFLCRISILKTGASKIFSCKCKISNKCEIGLNKNESRMHSKNRNIKMSLSHFTLYIARSSDVNNCRIQNHSNNRGKMHAKYANTYTTQQVAVKR